MLARGAQCKQQLVQLLSAPSLSGILSVFQKGGRGLQHANATKSNPEVALLSALLPRHLLLADQVTRCSQSLQSRTLLFTDDLYVCEMYPIPRVGRLPQAPRLQARQTLTSFCAFNGLRGLVHLQTWMLCTILLMTQMLCSAVHARSNRLTRALASPSRR